MAVDISVARRLPNNYAQVDVTPKNMDTRHYKVPVDNVDSFTASYKKYDSKTRTSSTVLMTALVLAGAFIGTLIPKAFKAKSVFSIICGVFGAVAGDFCATLITAKNMQKNESKILKNNQAEEMFIKTNADFLK